MRATMGARPSATRTQWPDTIANTTELDDLLSEPTPAAIDTLARLDGDIIVLGVGGKMGPTLARMARRASDAAGVTRRVIGVARFTDDHQQAALQAHGVETIRTDLLARGALDGLPDATNVVFMAGRKFGSAGLESSTWAMNTYLPAAVCQRYLSSRIAAFSTGNVYGLTPVGCGGSREGDQPAPVGEYAMSCLGRERMFEHFSRTDGTKVTILRLNYATEMRYGLLVDLARRIADGQVVDLTMGHANVIWQGDANAMALTSLAHAATPPLVVNIAGTEELSVRDTATALAARMRHEVRFVHQAAGDALLSDGTLGWRTLGSPQVTLTRLIDWTADWVRRGGAHLDKPTHFESRDGRF